jgi:hypothetical protein
MFNSINIRTELLKQKKNSLKKTDFVLDEVNKILKAELFKEHNILNNLKSYNKSFALLDEEGLDETPIFRKEEIKDICVKYRLRFVDSQKFKGHFPYEAVLKIKDLNKHQGKDLEGFKILAAPSVIKDKNNAGQILIFAPTIYGNYYLIHSWGQELKWMHKILSFPLRNFETLGCCLILLALITDLCIPTRHITLDRDATYWCAYRFAVFFHLLIFYSGFTIYILFGFNKPFSGSLWDSDKGL